MHPLFASFTVTKIPARSKDEAYAWVFTHYRTGAHVVQCLHDDFCAALRTHRDADCSPDCSPDWYLLTLVDEGALRCN